MSELEHYDREFLEIDREIRHYAAICGLTLSDEPEAMASCLQCLHETGITDPARETLYGLLLLRLKVETEMLEDGRVPPPRQTTDPLA